MYINEIKLKNFRTFQDEKITFIHPDNDFSKLNIPKPQLENVNLLLGNNASGKTALLKAISLAALGPAVSSSGIFPYRLVRQGPEGSKNTSKTSKSSQIWESEAELEATFTPHEQDQVPGIKIIESKIKVVRKGDLEKLEWSHSQDKSWHPIYSEKSDAFFFVGYGATRRVESQNNIDPSSRNSSTYIRAQRVKGLFEESYSLFPLGSWLPQYKKENPGRYKQIIGLINRLMGAGHFAFEGRVEEGEFLFEKNGMKIPFAALSDGYRAFLGWIGDLLYHVSQTCPPGKKLVENKGIVMVDEIDLHLHPSWQMTILPTIAKHLPKIQFIVTSHSPLVVGTLEWMNIILMSRDQTQTATHPIRLEKAVHGLDADQILLTDFFGLDSSRAESKNRTLKELTLSASQGDAKAARQLLKQMVKGAEATK